MLIIKLIKGKNRSLYFILVLPVILDFFMIVKMSPYKSVRYIMNILPIITILVIILIDDYFKNNKKLSLTILTSLSIIISIIGLSYNPVKYLYKGYNSYLEIAKKYKDDRFVLIGSAKFNHLQDLPEFTTYKESMILAPYDIEYLSTFKEFEEDDEIILGVKNWLDEPAEAILKKVMTAARIYRL